MKNRMEGNRKILLFHIDRKKETLIRMICNSAETKVVVIADAEYGEKLGVLAGIHGMTRSEKKEAAPPFAAEMMIFSGMDSQALDEFLDQYRAAQIPPVALKAVLTAHNVHWSVKELQEELMKERMEFLKRQK